MAHAVGAALPLGGVFAWLTTALASAVVGLVVGGAIAGVLQLVRLVRRGKPAH
jgi:predicted DNA repair protein MutK